MKHADLEFILSSKLPMMERMTMVVIASYINEGQTNAWPSIDTIAARGGMSRASAVRSIAALQKNGFLGMTRRYSDSTIYTINHAGSYALPDQIQQIRSSGSDPVEHMIGSTGAHDRLSQRKLIGSTGAPILPLEDSTNESTNESTNILCVGKKKKAADQCRVIPPTLEMVQEYCTTDGNGIDPEAFMFHYGQKDWMLSKGVKMKNWKMAIGTWVKNRDKYDNKPQARPSVQREQDNGPEPVYDQAAIDAVTTPEDIKRAWDTAVRLGCAVLP